MSNKGSRETAFMSNKCSGGTAHAGFFVIMSLLKVLNMVGGSRPVFSILLCDKYCQSRHVFSYSVCVCVLVCVFCLLICLLT